MIKKSLLLFLLPIVAFSCVEDVNGYYFPGGYVNGSLPVGFVVRPAGLSCSDLEDLHSYCVDRINLYRSGQLLFSGGTTDKTLGSPPQLFKASGNYKCENEITLGDFALMSSSCLDGVHKNAYSCPLMQGPQAQTSCCPRFGTTLLAVKRQLNLCLQAMWNEGLTNNTVGNWLTMKNPVYLFASCGFAFRADGYVLMQQNYAASFASFVFPTSSPSKAPFSGAPSLAPSEAPATGVPTLVPSFGPASEVPSLAPSKALTPSGAPFTQTPSSGPTTRTPSSLAPSLAPSQTPSLGPVPLK